MTNSVGISEAEVEKLSEQIDRRLAGATVTSMRALLGTASKVIPALRTALTSVTAERDKARNNALKEAADAAPDTAGYIARIAYNEGYCEGITKYRNAIRALQHTEGQSE